MEIITGELVEELLVLINIIKNTFKCYSHIQWREYNFCIEIHFDIIWGQIIQNIIGWYNCAGVIMKRKSSIREWKFWKEILLKSFCKIQYIILIWIYYYLSEKNFLTKLLHLLIFETLLVRPTNMENVQEISIILSFLLVLVFYLQFSYTHRLIFLFGFIFQFYFYF